MISPAWRMVSCLTAAIQLAALSLCYDMQLLLIVQLFNVQCCCAWTNTAC